MFNVYHYNTDVHREVAFTLLDIFVIYGPLPKLYNTFTKM